MPEIKRFPAVFFRSRSGREPVREWLRSLSREDRRVLGQDLQRLEYRWPVGMPLVRPLGAGLYEVRSNLTGGRTARVMLLVGDQRLVLLHGFLKKTRATPREALELAQDRKRVWEIENA